MADIFLSYAREDSAKAAIIARALSARGLTVWWDRAISPGKTFDDVIEDALDHASCIVVLWSKASVSSHWVRAEAAEGARRGILVPALIESAKIPLEFRRVQSADFTSWLGDPAAPAFEQFVLSITTLMPREKVVSWIVPPGQTRERPPPPNPAEKPHATRRRPQAAAWVTAVAIVAATAGGFGWWYTTGDAGVPPRTEKPLEQARTLPQPSAPPVAASDTRIVVPSIVGQRVDDARTQLEGIGLSVGNLRETNERGPAGTVTAQRPTAGARVSPGAAVDLVVTKALAAKPATDPRGVPSSKTNTQIAKGVEVPDLTGLPIDQARDRVARRGLTVGSVTGRASDMPTGSVLSQEPAAGTRQPAGTPVSLVIAERPRVEPPAQIQVPALIGLSEPEATDLLRRNRLERGRITRRPTSTSEPGRVLTQRIAAGTLVPSGTSVDLEVSGVPANTDAARGGRSPATNSITNFRATDRSPSEVTIDADVFYDGAQGEVFLVAVAMNGKARSDGILARLWSPLPVGAGRANVTLYMSGTVAESTSTDVELCIRPQRRGPPTAPIHCQTFPLARKWVLPMNRVTAFRGADVSTYEYRASIFIWYDGRHGASEISLRACPRGADTQALARGIRCGHAPLQVGPNNVTVTLMMGGDAQVLESTSVEVCLVGPGNSKVSECRVYRHEKRWSR